MRMMLTMDGKQGAVRRINPDVAILIHYDDYNRFKSKLSDFPERNAGRRYARASGLFDRGQTYEFSINQ